MRPLLLSFAVSSLAFSQAPKLPGIGEAMQRMIAQHEMAGAVTVVANQNSILHLEANGMADVGKQQEMSVDAMAWIASMTKPITGAAILMLQDEGKLDIADPVSKYLPEFASLKTPSGKPANLTITQILTHTSGLGEAVGPKAQEAQTLADLVPIWLSTPMQFEPGSQWKYCQSGINAAARIVEVLSGMSFDAFLQKRLFDPLGMTNTTFYPSDTQWAKVATGYAKNPQTGKLETALPRSDFGQRGRPPQGNGGLYSCAKDYTRFCQMLLNGGMLDGKRLLSSEAVKKLSSVHTSDLPCGFFQQEEFGNHGTNYGWGIGTCVLKQPHEGLAEMLSPGTFGHGGAWGTQAWIDPKKHLIYVLIVQRANFTNSDASPVREAFQKAAAKALAK